MTLRSSVRIMFLGLAACGCASSQQAKPAFVPEEKTVFHAGVAPVGFRSPGSTFPAAEWERVSSPESAGYSRIKLDALRAWLKTQNTTAMLVVVGGRVLFEYGDTRQVSKVASVRKSILGMIFGNYVVSGKVDLFKTVKQLGLNDLEPFLPIEEHATLQDLLMARSGIYFEFDENAPRKGSQRPGALFYYNNWDFNAAGTAFEKLTGKNIFDALETDLARPVGMQDYDRTKQKKIQTIPQKLLSVHPEYAMYLSTRDMARIGLLMTRDGDWNGKQVLPRNWSGYLTTLYTPVSEIWSANMRSSEPNRWGYGALWWVWDAPRPHSSGSWGYFTGAYSAMGTDGQYITVLPKYDLVVAHKNANIDQTPDRDVSVFEYQTILQMLLAAYCGQDCK